MSADRNGHRIFEQSGVVLTFPHGMEFDGLVAALDTIRRQVGRDEEYVNLHELIEANPFDGAHALMCVLQEQWGFILQNPDEDGEAHSIGVEVGPGKTVQVPWGEMVLPGIDGTVEVGGFVRNSKVFFRMSARVRRKYENVVLELVRKVKDKLATSSVYRGKALKIAKFTDRYDNLDSQMSPEFMGLAGNLPLVLNSDVEEAIDTCVTVPIANVIKARELGLSVRRGVLLYGPYGTGKSLLAYKIAAEAVKSGWTFIYVMRAKELAHARSFARQYQPAVIFVEDLDTVTEERDQNLYEEIARALDGVDGKDDEIMIVATTNRIRRIPELLLRPGRFDLKIGIGLPDSESVKKLLLIYGKGYLPEDIDLDIFSEMSPAVIREVIERILLAALKSGGLSTIHHDQVAAMAKRLNGELELGRHFEE